MKNTVSVCAGRRKIQTWNFLWGKKKHWSSKQIRKILKISQILEGSGNIFICYHCSGLFSTCWWLLGVGSGTNSRDSWVFRVKKSDTLLRNMASKSTGIMQVLKNSIFSPGRNWYFQYLVILKLEWRVCCHVPKMENNLCSKPVLFKAHLLI